VHPGSHPTHPSASYGDLRGREARRSTIREATRVLMIEHEVVEMAAYGILVQASVDARSSVRETALRVLAGRA